MFWKKGPRVLRTVTGRLTLWYALLFALSSLIAFCYVYLDLRARLNERLDAQIGNEINELESFYLSGGMENLRLEFAREAAAYGEKKIFFRLLSPGGEDLFASDLSGWPEQLRPFALADLPPGREVLETRTLAHTHEKIRLIYRRMADGSIMQAGYALREIEAELELYRETFGTAICGMLLSGGIAAWLISKRAMAGVERVTQTAFRISQGGLTHRVQPGNEGEEIDNLAKTFNTMLGRIESLLSEWKEVSDNIAHDLRSPITRMRGIAETTLAGEQNLEEYRDMAGVIVEESDRLVNIINTMLEIAENRSGAAVLSGTCVDLAKIVRDAEELFLPLAEDQGIRLRLKLPPEPLPVPGDQRRLQRVMANLLDNAIKFTPPGGEILLAVEGGPSQATVAVVDSGIGIAAADLPRIFDRFYRGDQSRSTPGNGLGLSLVQAIVQAHGGKISVRSTPGQGSAFLITLPRPVPA
jgi:signal transduction histidine kinase